MSSAHRFMLMTLIPHRQGTTPHDRYAQVTAQAEFAESIGFDGFGVGERHDPPYISSSPAVLLGHLAARTSRIRLFTAATTIAMHDPLRAYEDYATVDQLSGGRLELMIGTGLGEANKKFFGIAPEEQVPRTVEAYDLFRHLWDNPEKARHDGSQRPPLDGVELSPLPLQAHVPVWHTGLKSRESAARAAAWGEPYVIGSLFSTKDEIAASVQAYREEWVAAGHEAGAEVVGVGIAGAHVAPTSQQAREEFRAAFAATNDAYGKRLGNPPFADYEQYLGSSTALLGSPAEVQEKFALLQESWGHALTYHHADSPGLDETTWRRGKELLAESLFHH